MQQSLQVFSSSEVDSTIPLEKTSGETLITTDPEVARNLLLKRGQYRVVFETPFDGKEKSIRETLKKIKYDGEFKRIYFYKLDVVDTGRIVPDDTEGAGMKIAQVTAVFHVLDNPILLAPIIWGAAIVGGGIFGWLTMKEVNTFTDKAAGSVFLIAAAIVGVYFAVMRK